MTRLRALLAKWWPVPVAALACVGSFLAGRYSKPAEVRTKVETRTETVTMYAAHLTTTSTDKGKVRIVTVTKREPGGTVYVTRTEDRANDLRLDLNWTGTASESQQTQAAASTVTRSSSVGWAVGASATWSSPTPKPATYTLEVDRRLFGTLWVGVRANTDKQFGAAARLEF